MADDTHGWGNTAMGTNKMMEAGVKTQHNGNHTRGDLTHTHAQAHMQAHTHTHTHISMANRRVEEGVGVGVREGGAGS